MRIPIFNQLFALRTHHLQHRPNTLQTLQLIGLRDRPKQLKIIKVLMIVIIQQRIELKVGLRVNGTNKDGIDGDPLVEEANDFNYVPID